MIAQINLQPTYRNISPNRANALRPIPALTMPKLKLARVWSVFFKIKNCVLLCCFVLPGARSVRHGDINYRGRGFNDRASVLLSIKFCERCHFASPIKEITKSHHGMTVKSVMSPVSHFENSVWGAV